ncbi:MAG: hypothetical protein JNN08_16085 [Bryobacterales bacterium]|nr:hypothetical protein [Bryobacterales bacterium]
MKRIRLVLVLTGLALPGWADADFGIRTKHSATITVSRPPDALLRGKTIAIKSRQGVAFREQQTLELAIEKALAGEYTPTKGNAELVLTFAVARAEPVQARKVVQTERRNVKVGQKQGKNIITGKPMMVDIYDMRDVPVEYWDARGTLALQVTVHDGAGALLDSFDADGAYQRKVEVAVNRVATNKETLPTEEALQAELIEQAASDIRKRYTKTTEPVEVRLTVDDPLRPGNAQAMAGQWKEALASWSAAAMKKNPGDRAYNMAVAHEALAYQVYDASRNPDDSQESFQKAIQLYEEALRSDPGEKFFRQAMERCGQMKANFTRAKDQYAAQERLAQLEVAKAEAKQQQEEEKRKQQEEALAELNSKRADTQDEADFRTIARGRLKSLNGEQVSADFQTKLVAFGRDAYKLEELPARRVVHQEIERKKRMGANLELYKQTFADLVGADKALDANDRSALNRLAARLELAPDEVKPIEAQFQFNDLTAPPPPPAPAPAPAPAAKKATAAKPKPAAAKPAAAQAPTPTKPAAPAGSAIKK